MQNQATVAVDNKWAVMGRKGGNETKRRYTKRFFRLIGKKGGRPKKQVLALDLKQAEAIK